MKTHVQIRTEKLDGVFTLSAQFHASNAGRESAIQKAEMFADWTEPSIFPLDTALDESFSYTQQSFGAQCVNNLVNKMVTTMFPPAQPFFRLELSKEDTAILAEEGTSDTDTKEMLSNTEQDAITVFNDWGGRVAMTQVAEQLLVAGDVLLISKEDEDMRIETLRNYVVWRGVNGTIRKVILRETTSYVELREELQQQLHAYGYSNAEGDETVELFTCIELVGPDQYFVWQELEDIAYAHKHAGVMTADELPFTVMTFKRRPRSNYGSGYIEQYAGDFAALERSEAVQSDFEAVITDVKNLVKQTSAIDPLKISAAPSGSYHYGEDGDITSYTADVGNNVAFLEGRQDRLERRLARAFLLTGATTRDAERVTAEEIRQQSFEIHGAFGGTYSHLKKETQAVVARRSIRKLDPDLQSLKPIITTGLESLSRNAELDNWRAFTRDLAEFTAIPEKAAERLNYDKMVKTLGTGHGLKIQDVVLTEDQVQANRKQAIEMNAALAGTEAKAVNQAQQ